MALVTHVVETRQNVHNNEVALRLAMIIVLRWLKTSQGLLCMLGDVTKPLNRNPGSTLGGTRHFWRTAASVLSQDMKLYLDLRCTNNDGPRELPSVAAILGPCCGTDGHRIPLCN